MPVTRPVAFDLVTRARLFDHLAAMENAGVPVGQAFASLQLPAKGRAGLDSLRRQIEQGRDLASAGQKAGLFTPLEVTLLQAAQNAGSPGRLYARLADTYGRKARHLAAMKSRLLMPAAVFLIALFVQPLPRLVGGSLGIGGYLWTCLQPILLLAGLLILGRFCWRRMQRRHGSPLDAWLLRLPLLGQAHARRNIRDYFESLALMLEAGVPMFDALPKATATLGNRRLRLAFAGLQGRVLGGQPLAEAIQPLDFPGKATLAGLIRTGEASGTLPATLLRYANLETQALDSFEEQLATWLPRLVYAALVVWMAYGLLTGAGVTSLVPVDLR
jgi:type II secretory pathway component PulF